MKITRTVIGLFMILCVLCNMTSAQEDVAEFPKLTGPYLGQQVPGMVPEVFAAGVISTGMNEFASAFSPDKKGFFFNNSSGPVPAILFTKQVDGNWTEPEVASFSGRFRDYDPSWSPDGTRLYFSSDRSPDEDGAIENNVDIWVIERTGDDWSQARHLGETVNSDANEYYPCATRNGNLYFSSGRKGGYGGNDIYCCRWVEGMYLPPENLGENINSSNFEGDVFVSPDESYMIVTCYNRSDGLGSGDLYLGVRDTEGRWSRLKNMGSPINSYANEHCPMVSPDGDYLFFTSYRNEDGIPLSQPLKYGRIRTMQLQPGNGRGDIYWVDGKIIEKKKTEPSE